METFFASLAPCVGNSPVNVEFPSQRSVTQSFDVFFDLRLDKPLSKQSIHRWFEMPLYSLWRHRNAHEIWWHKHKKTKQNKLAQIHEDVP